jgi:hypothetical protein
MFGRTPPPAMATVPRSLLSSSSLRICLYRWKRARMRRGRLPTSHTDPKRPQGDLRAPKRQVPTDAAVMAGPSISRIKKINFFGPQEVSH